jgi:hypothetical protein
MKGSPSQNSWTVKGYLLRLGWPLGDQAAVQALAKLPHDLYCDST